jgi:hypothetical protein
MLARVTTWEGGTADAIHAATHEIRANVAEGPPPGVTSSGFTMLSDPDSGRTLMIGLFESEEDLRDSEAALAAMTPPDGLGTRTAVDVYHVIAEVRKPGEPPVG